MHEKCAKISQNLVKSSTIREKHTKSIHEGIKFVIFYFYSGHTISDVLQKRSHPACNIYFTLFLDFRLLHIKVSCFRFYQCDLPFLLVFGVATTVEVIHRCLPHGTTSKLAIQSFAAAPSIHLLAKFVESLVMDRQVPFKLGAGVLKTLLESFSFHDLSVRHFLMGLKVSFRQNEKFE